VKSTRLVLRSPQQSCARPDHRLIVVEGDGDKALFRYVGQRGTIPIPTTPEMITLLGDIYRVIAEIHNNMSRCLTDIDALVVQGKVNNTKVLVRRAVTLLLNSRAKIHGFEIEPIEASSEHTVIRI